MDAHTFCGDFNSCHSLWGQSNLKISQGFIGKSFVKGGGGEESRATPIHTCSIVGMGTVGSSWELPLVSHLTPGARYPSTVTLYKTCALDGGKLLIWDPYICIRPRSSVSCPKPVVLQQL